MLDVDSDSDEQWLNYFNNLLGLRISRFNEHDFYQWINQCIIMNEIINSYPFYYPGLGFRQIVELMNICSLIFKIKNKFKVDLLNYEMKNGLLILLN